MCSHNGSLVLNDTFDTSLSEIKKVSLFITLYIIPVICIIGTINNFFNIIVFSNKKMKEISFKYMLLISISDMFYLGFCSYAFVATCEICPLNSDYSTQIFEILINSYATSCLAILSILAEIGLSVHRSLIFLNKANNIPFKIPLIIMLVISFSYYSIYLFSMYITSNNECINDNNKTLTKVKYKVDISKYGSVGDIVLTSVRILLGVGVLTTVNLINVIIFKNKSFKPFKNLNNLNNNASKLSLKLTFFKYILQFINIFRIAK